MLDFLRCDDLAFGVESHYQTNRTNLTKPIKPTKPLHLTYGFQPQDSSAVR